ncbi:hypothetical protein AAHC03_021000 [Spirometra sp. Aus1]
MWIQSMAVVASRYNGASLEPAESLQLNKYYMSLKSKIITNKCVEILNWFTIPKAPMADLRIMWDCAALALATIKRIYVASHKKTPKILVIGHSMGGLVAHNLLTRKDSDPSLVHTVVTLASPLVFPVIGVGSEMYDIYSRVRSLWNAVNTTAKFEHLVFLSITGGPRDIQVWDGLSDANHWLPPAYFLHQTTSAISGVWLTCDHLCIMWCKQLVLALNRAFFDMVDPTTLAPLPSREARMAVIRSHLVSQPVNFDFLPTNGPLSPEPLQHFANCLWAYQVGAKTVVYEAHQTSHCTLLKLGPISQSDGEKILLFPFQLEIEDVFVCENDGTSSTSPCMLHRLPASSVRSTKVPGTRESPARPRHLLTVSVDGQQFKNLFLVLRLSHYGPASLLYEVVPPSRIDVSRTLPLPNWYPSKSPVHLNRTLSTECLSSTPCRQSQLPVFFRFYLPEFAHGPTLPTPVLSISLSDCSPSVGQFGLTTVYFPWDNQVYHTKLRKNAENNVILRSLSPQKLHSHRPNPYVDIILEPTCQLTDVTVHYSFFQWFYEILRVHVVHAAPSLLAGHLLISLLIEVASPFVFTRTLEARISGLHILHFRSPSGFLTVFCRLRAPLKRLYPIFILSLRSFLSLLEAIMLHALCALLACFLRTLYFILFSTESSWLESTWSHFAVGSHSSTLRNRLYSLLTVYILHLHFAVAAPTVIQILADSCLGLPLLIRLFSPVLRLQRRASNRLLIAPSNSLLLLIFSSSLLFHDGIAYLLLSVWVLSQCLTSSACAERRERTKDAEPKGTPEPTAPSHSTASRSLRVLCRLTLILLFCSLLSIQQWIDFVTQLRTSPLGSLVSRPLAMTPVRATCLLLLLLRHLFSGRICLIATASSSLCAYVAAFSLAFSVLVGTADALHRFDACIYLILACLLLLYCSATRFPGTLSGPLGFSRPTLLSPWHFSGWVIKMPCGRPKEANRRV